ncbi:MAG: type II toxin-antitoxin system PemK/MazF family toxin [Ignavibacteriales bacterium]|nr:type II toxin-antitoxin system PemK/MazF family toxin [Ignavibacteriales bacterium]
MTSQLSAQTFPGTFLIKPDEENNLERTSVALVFQVRAIDKRRLKNKIGKLNTKQLSELRKNMDMLLH